MREVDTQALRSVARSLGIGNPSTATAPVVFDDDNLQQSLDVGALVSYGSARRAELHDGWVTLTIPLSCAGVVNWYTTSQGIGAAGFPGILEDGDCLWIYSITADISADTSFGHAMVSLALPSTAEIGATSRVAYPLLMGDTTFTYALAAGTLVPDKSPGNPITLPAAAPDGSSIIVTARQTGATAFTMTTTIVGRILPAGVPPRAF